MIDLNGNKCVIIIDDELSTGLVANTAAVLAANVGRDHPEIFGPDIQDANGMTHRGITAMPFPILQADQEKLRMAFERARGMQGVEACAFNNVAQGSRAYGEYTEKLAATATDDLAYSGVMFFGPSKKVNKLSSSLGLLR